MRAPFLRCANPWPAYAFGMEPSDFLQSLMTNLSAAAREFAGSSISTSEPHWRELPRAAAIRHDEALCRGQADGAIRIWLESGRWPRVSKQVRFGLLARTEHASDLFCCLSAPDANNALFAVDVILRPEFLDWLWIQTWHWPGADHWFRDFDRGIKNAS
jgi:hypothetical protein